MTIAEHLEANDLREIIVNLRNKIAKGGLIGWEEMQAEKKELGWFLDRFQKITGQIE